MSSAPKNTADSVPVSLAFNLLGRVAMVLSGALVSIVLAKHYGAQLFGQWSVALVYGTLVGTVVEGGLGRVLIRDASRDPSIAGRALGTVLKGQLGLGVVFVPVALVVSYLLNPAWGPWLLVLLLVAVRFLEGLQSSYQRILITLGNHRSPNIIETGRRLGRVFGVAAVVLLGAQIHWAAIAILLVTVLTTGVLISATKERVPSVDFSAPLASSWRDAGWFWINGVLFWVNGEIDQLMLSEMAGDRATGIYAAAARFALLFLIIPQTVNNTVIPKLFRSAKSGVGLFRQYNSTTLLLAAIGSVVAVEVWFTGPELIHLVYATEYSDSAPVFQWYGFFVLLHFLRVPATWFLSTSDRVPMATAILLAACITNVVANIFLIPTHAAVGAAWATIGSEAMIFLIAGGLTFRFLGLKVLMAPLMGLTVGGVAYFVHAALAQALPWWLSAAITSVFGVAIVAAMAWRLLKGWNPMGLMSDQEASARS